MPWAGFRIVDVFTTRSYQPTLVYRKLYGTWPVLRAKKKKKEKKRKKEDRRLRGQETNGKLFQVSPLRGYQL